MAEVTFKDCICPHGYYVGVKVTADYVCNHGSDMCRWCRYVVPADSLNRDRAAVLRQHCYEQFDAEKKAGGPIVHWGPLVPR